MGLAIAPRAPLITENRCMICWKFQPEKGQKSQKEPNLSLNVEFVENSGSPVAYSKAG